MPNSNLRYETHVIEKTPRKQFGLLGLTFKDSNGRELTWWPKWDEVRMIFWLAIATEWFNEGPYKWSETKKFLKLAEDFPETLNVWASQAVSKDRGRLIQLLQSGNLRQAAELLTKTDLLEVAEWVKQNASVSP